jgi:hypothetical protein
VLADMLHGNEPRELVRELYRMRRRARALAGTAFGVADGVHADGDTGRDNAGDLAAPSIAAARSPAGALDKQDAEELSGPAGTTPFRHQE